MVRLERMAEDLLDVSHIDAHQLQLHLRPVELVEIARASIERMSTLAGSSAIELVSPDRLPCRSADPDRIGQVLDNLLSNAIKYGNPGLPIRVELARTGGAAATLSVCNKGPGIAPKDLPFLFQRFHRTAGAWRSGVRGTGLGLHIARALVEAHGGTLELRSPGPRPVFRMHGYGVLGLS